MRKYLSDYRLPALGEEPGSEAAYIGDRFDFEDPARARLAAKQLAVYCGLGWAGFVLALVPASGGGTAFWSALPLAFSALPLGIASASLAALFRTKGPMVRSAAERISGKLPRALLWALCLAGAALLGEAVLALFLRERLLRGDALYTAGALLECAACAAGYARKNALAVKKQET